MWRTNYPRQQTQFYESYWTQQDIDDAKGRGEKLITGSFQVQTKFPFAGYVMASMPYTFITDFADRNRALPGDKVLVVLHPFSKWRVTKAAFDQYEASDNKNDSSNIASEDSDLEPSGAAANPKDTTKYISVQELMDKGNSKAIKLFRNGKDGFKQKLGTDWSQMVKPTGKIVCILEENHSRGVCGYFQFNRERDRYFTWFLPVDRRVPKFCMDLTPPIRAMMAKNEHHILCYVKIKEWPQTSKTPKGVLEQVLGPRGNIKAETEAILVSNDIHEPHETQIRPDCLSISTAEQHTRKDLRSVCVFTVDDKKTKDLDDAISCEEIGYGVLEIGVHISDVAHFVQPGTDLDIQAKKRATSTYLVKRDINMLPNKLAEDVCSLRQNEDRRTISFLWKVTETSNGYTIATPWIGRTIVRSCARLTFQDVEAILDDQKYLSDIPKVSNPFTLTDLASRVRHLNKITHAMSQASFEDGYLPVDSHFTEYIVDDAMEPMGFIHNDCMKSNRIISELMMLTNRHVATKITSCFPEHALLRKAIPKKRDAVAALASEMAIKLDTSSLEDLLKSLGKNSLTKLDVLRQKAPQSMENAHQRKYFLSKSSMAENVIFYTGFTSPIRRYPDLIAQRQLLETLEPKQFPCEPKASIEEDAIDHFLVKDKQAANAQRDHNFLYFWNLIKRKGEMNQEAIVNAVDKDFMDVMLVGTRLTKRIFREPMEQKQQVKWALEKDKTVSSVNLSWPSRKFLKLSPLDDVMCRVFVDEKTQKFWQHWHCEILPPE